MQSVPALLCAWTSVGAVITKLGFVYVQDLNWPYSQIPQCTYSISHNAPFRTEMCTFLFWMVYCLICWPRFVSPYAIARPQCVKDPLKQLGGNALLLILSSWGWLRIISCRFFKRMQSGDYQTHWEIWVGGSTNFFFCVIFFFIKIKISYWISCPHLTLSTQLSSGFGTVTTVK